MNPKTLGERMADAELRIRELETQMRVVRGIGALFGTFVVGLLLWAIAQAVGVAP